MYIFVSISSGEYELLINVGSTPTSILRVHAVIDFSSAPVAHGRPKTSKLEYLYRFY
jgi:hypothetical protein